MYSAMLHKLVTLLVKLYISFTWHVCRMEQINLTQCSLRNKPIRYWRIQIWITMHATCMHKYQDNNCLFFSMQHDFCTYLQIEYAEMDSSSTRLKEVAFSLPATMQEIPHGEPVLRICSLVDSTLITAQEDGQISFWSPEFKLKRSKMVFVRHMFLFCSI